MVTGPVPAAAVMVGAPPQLFTTFGAVAITRLAGKVWVKVRLVLAGAPAGLVMVKVSVEVCPTPTVVGAKALVSTGRDWNGRRLNFTLFEKPAVALSLPPELLYGPPTTFDVTSTVTTHE